MLVSKAFHNTYLSKLYLSKLLNETERNYEIYNKEILAVIKILKNWKYLLESIKFKVEVWTDHKNLQYFIKVQTSPLDIISIEI